MTDSEDEDSENEFEQPSWVNTPNLREMLSNQQLMDPEHIFGPIAPLEMEKVFPNKERHKRFRERTSSAYWANDEVPEHQRHRPRAEDVVAPRPVGRLRPEAEGARGERTSCEGWRMDV